MPRRADLVDDGTGGLGGVAVVHQHLCSVRGQTPRHRRPDPAGPARNQGDLSFESGSVHATPPGWYLHSAKQAF